MSGKSRTTLLIGSFHPWPMCRLEGARGERPCAVVFDGSSEGRSESVLAESARGPGTERMKPGEKRRSLTGQPVRPARGNGDGQYQDVALSG